MRFTVKVSKISHLVSLNGFSLEFQSTYECVLWIWRVQKAFKCHWIGIQLSFNEIATAISFCSRLSQFPKQLSQLHGKMLEGSQEAQLCSQTQLCTRAITGWGSTHCYWPKLMGLANLVCMNTVSLRLVARGINPQSCIISHPTTEWDWVHFICFPHNTHHTRTLALLCSMSLWSQSHWIIMWNKRH